MIVKTWYQVMGFGYLRNAYSEDLKPYVEAAMKRIDPSTPLEASEISTIIVDAGGMIRVNYPVYLLEFLGLRVEVPVLHTVRLLDLLLHTEPHPTDQIPVSFMMITGQTQRLIVSASEREAMLDAISPHAADLRRMAAKEAMDMAEALNGGPMVDRETGKPISAESFMQRFAPKQVTKSLN